MKRMSRGLFGTHASQTDGRFDRVCLMLVLAVLAAGVGGCDGGGGGSASATAPPIPALQQATPLPGAPPPLTCETPPKGTQTFATDLAAVGGTIMGRTDPSFILLQAPDYGGRGFDRWLIYGPDLAQAPVITGVIHSGGGVACNGNDRTAVNGGDSGSGEAVYLRAEIGTAGAGAVLLDGGSLRYRTTPPVTYGLGPRPIPGIVPNYALSPALLANAVGSWTLNDRLGIGMSVDVAADGAFALRYRGCSLRGNLRVGDRGMYTATARLEATSCMSSPWQGATYEGVALAYPLTTGGWQMVFALSINNGVDGDDMVALGRR